MLDLDISLPMSFSWGGPSVVRGWTLVLEGVDTIPSESRKFYFSDLGHADV